MTGKTRWGILGPGKIAEKFATGLTAVDDAEIAAVGSRDHSRAQEFADRHGAPRAYGSYEELAADTDVDAVYVATPHTFHKEHSLLCLEAGKAVLCEKPFTINEADSRTVVEFAREKGVLLVEAMWTRFLPVSAQVRQWIAEGRIGQVRMVMADFGFRAGKVDPKGRLFDPALGGGGILDVGVYPVSYASMIFGAEPERVACFADMGETGVDEQAAMMIDYGKDKVASLTTGVRTMTPHQAWILGEKGRIFVDAFWHSELARLEEQGAEAVEFKAPHLSNGYEYEAMEVGKCLAEGRIQSDIMPWDETLRVMRTLDRIRAEIGLKYPME